MPPRNANEALTPEVMTAALAPRIAKAAAAREEAKRDRRAKFPAMAEMMDALRAEGVDARPVFARNEAGETWGTDPSDPRDVSVDHLLAFIDTAEETRRKGANKPIRPPLRRPIMPR